VSAAIKLPVSALQGRLDVAEISIEQASILADVLTGATAAPLAEKYFLSIHGIDFRIRCIFRAFRVKSRTELIYLAATEGLHFQIRGDDSGRKIVHHVRVVGEKREF
jgi:DNA-binding NarL/FixJ family response regulator